MPDTIFQYLVYAALALFAALAAKVALRYRRDRRRVVSSRGCAFCDGIGGTHAPWCPTGTRNERDRAHGGER